MGCWRRVRARRKEERIAFSYAQRRRIEGVGVDGVKPRGNNSWLYEQGRLYYVKKKKTPKKRFKRREYADSMKKIRLRSPLPLLILRGSALQGLLIHVIRGDSYLSIITILYFYFIMKVIQFSKIELSILVSRQFSLCSSLDHYLERVLNIITQNEDLRSFRQMVFSNFFFKKFLGLSMGNPCRSAFSSVFFFIFLSLLNVQLAIPFLPSKEPFFHLIHLVSFMLLCFSQYSVPSSEIIMPPSQLHSWTIAVDLFRFPGVMATPRITPTNPK